MIHHFEAKHYALRKSKDGTVVSFVVHPNDLTPELQCLPIGAVVNIAWTLGDDKPVEVEPIEVKVPKAAQARVRKDERSLAERCAILCADKRFLIWLAKTWGMAALAPQAADAEIKKRLGITSKTELNVGSPNFNGEAAANFRLLVMTYESSQEDERYAQAHR